MQCLDTGIPRIFWQRDIFYFLDSFYLFFPHIGINIITPKCFAFYTCFMKFCLALNSYKYCKISALLLVNAIAFSLEIYPCFTSLAKSIFKVCIVAFPLACIILAI